MALGNWRVFHEALNKIQDNTIDLDGGVFRASLYKSSANLSAAVISILSIRNQISNEVDDGNGYSTSGVTMSGRTVGAGASSGASRWDATAVFWSANGGDITSIQYLVIWHSGASASVEHLVALLTLSTATFSLTDTNRLTVTPNALGMWNLTQA